VCFTERHALESDECIVGLLLVGVGQEEETDISAVGRSKLTPCWLLQRHPMA
jgi:hypothetical protein